MRLRPGARTGPAGAACRGRPERNAQAEAAASSPRAARELAGRAAAGADGSGSPELAAELLMLRSFPSGAGRGGRRNVLSAGRAVRVLAETCGHRLGQRRTFLRDDSWERRRTVALLRRLARALAIEAIERYEVTERFRALNHLGRGRTGTPPCVRREECGGTLCALWITPLEGRLRSGARPTRAPALLSGSARRSRLAELPDAGPNVDST